MFFMSNDDLLLFQHIEKLNVSKFLYYASLRILKAQKQNKR